MLFLSSIIGLLTTASASNLHARINNGIELNETVIERTYIIKLASASSVGPSIDIDHHAAFHRRAADVPYSVRHEFKTRELFHGLSITLGEESNEEELVKRLSKTPGVEAVYPVYNVAPPGLPGAKPIKNPKVSFPGKPPLPPRPSGGNLGSALEMSGVDKLHKLGFKGRGVKIGIVDTGVDYRHPALGGGFGPGFKIAGGYSFIDDDGAAVSIPDPLITCFGGAHGTHVSGILGMESTAESTGFDVVGVAPEASLYMYRVFPCSGGSGSDTILAGMLKAAADGVDVISMSLGGGPQTFATVDPYTAAAANIRDMGIAIIAAQGNNGAAGINSLESPGSLPDSIAVGAIANSRFPTVYPAVDTTGASIRYASVWPLNVTEKLDVFVVSPACDNSAWETAVNVVNVSKTILAFEGTEDCPIASIDSYWKYLGTAQPLYVLGYISTTITDPFDSEYATYEPGRYGNTSMVVVSAVDGVTFLKNYGDSGGYLKYKLSFDATQLSSPLQHSGGLMDYYSAFGPTFIDPALKPQLSAPGGHILATYPLGPGGGYAILSGTSMATPFAAGAYALLKSKNPSYSKAQILSLLQSNSVPTTWVTDKSILSSTAQQGSGLINVYAALTNSAEISPGQIKIGDNSHTQWGYANITIRNKSPSPKTFTLAHRGAGYMDTVLIYNEAEQLGQYGSATFESTHVSVPGLKSVTVTLSLTAPTGVAPKQRPIFSGFITATSSDGEKFSIPYIGQAYSQYNAQYIDNSNATLAGGVQHPLPLVEYINSTTNVGVWNFDIETSTIADEINVAYNVLQFSNNLRIDVMPANTNITVDTYGFDRTVDHGYNPSKVTPGDTVLGSPSYGNVINTGLSPPSGWGTPWAGTVVEKADGTSITLGAGDYRFLMAVQRWGGAIDNKDDYQTWLGPLMRIVDV